jgi:hypothetical protein
VCRYSTQDLNEIEVLMRHREVDSAAKSKSNALPSQTTYTRNAHSHTVSLVGDALPLTWFMDFAEQGRRWVNQSLITMGGYLGVFHAELVASTP